MAFLNQRHVLDKVLKKMKIQSLVPALIVAVCAFAAPLYGESLHCFELRTYTANDGKLDALHSRFRDHTMKIFERHGMTNIGYWVPQDNSENQLIYLLGYPSRNARDEAWKGFRADEEWQAAYKASTADGRLVKKVENVFLHLTDFSPEIKIGRQATDRAFELRTYTASEGNLGHLNARFREFTVDLFEKHGMTNFAYFNLLPGQDGEDNTLVYLLAHESKPAARAAFGRFGKDPEWRAARKQSEERAGGGLTARGGVKSVFLNPTDYSQTN